MSTLVREGVMGGKGLNVLDHGRQRLRFHKPDQVEHALAFKFVAALLDQCGRRFRAIDRIPLEIQNFVHVALLLNPSAETSTV